MVNQLCRWLRVTLLDDNRSQRIDMQMRTIMIAACCQSLRVGHSSQCLDATCEDLRGPLLQEQKIAARTLVEALLGSAEVSCLPDSEYDSEVQKHGGTVALLRHVLASDVFEVRKAAFKRLAAATHVDNTSLLEQLGSTLAERLELESDFKCARPLLQVVRKWLGSLSPSDASPDIWAALRRLYERSRAGSVREEAVKCMGAYLSRCLGAGWNDELAQGISWWIALLEDSSQTHMPTSSRSACGESIVSSGMLCLLLSAEASCSNVVRDSIVRVWLISLRLLEDEDESTRRTIGSHMSTALSAYPENKIAVASPVQEGKIIEAVFRALVRAESSGVLHKYLIGLLTGCHKGSIRKSDLELVRKLFDREVDNHHHEEVMFVQLASKTLSIVHSCRSNSSVVADKTAWTALSDGWRHEMCRELVENVKCIKEMQTASLWAGGVTNHAEIFIALYRSLLGLLALGRTAVASHVSSSVMAEVAEVVTSVLSIQLHPALQSAVDRVSDAYGISPSSFSEVNERDGDPEAVSSFGPFFLLSSTSVA
eukprot:scaffold412_cov388-Prasinococcus_capsulatus_cf.AAC.24